MNPFYSNTRNKPLTITVGRVRKSVVSDTCMMANIAGRGKIKHNILLICENNSYMATSYLSNGLVSVHIPILSYPYFIEVYAPHHERVWSCIYVLRHIYFGLFLHDFPIGFLELFRMCDIFYLCVT